MGSTASISARATARPSAGRSRRTRAACTCCVTARPGASCSGSRRCSPTAASSRRLDGLEKDNTGYDLAGLLCGSEGTLADRHRGAAAPRRAARARGRRAVRVRRRRRRARRGRGAPSRTSTTLHAIELFLPGRTRPRVRSFALARAVSGPARCVRARRGGRRASTRPTRSREVLQGLPSIADVAVATDSIERRRARCGGTASAHRRDQPASARRTSST